VAPTETEERRWAEELRVATGALETSAKLRQQRGRLIGGGPRDDDADEVAERRVAELPPAL
jgi:hypothetical protein